MAAITGGDVIAIEQKEVGTVEKPDNLTKYGEWYGFNGVPWCAIFQSWALSNAGIPTHESYTPAWAEVFQSEGTWDDEPQRGDLVFYSFGGVRIDHVEMVTGVEDTVIHTIGGNTSSGTSGSQSNGGGVFQRTRPRDDSIIGYGRPAYTGAGKPNKKPKKHVRNNVMLNDTGSDVRTLQAHLKKLGFELDVDGEFGPVTEQCVKRFQRSAGIEVDGVAGIQTFRAIKKAVKEL